MAADPYKALGILRDADPEEVRAAYHRAALKCHPDVFAGDPREAERLFRDVTAAYKAILRQRGQRRIGLPSKTFSPQDLAIMEMARSAMGKSVPPQKSAPPQKTAKPETISFVQFGIIMAIVSVLIGSAFLAYWTLTWEGDRHTAPEEKSSQTQLTLLDLGDGVMMKLALIPAGNFMMGSPDGEKDRVEDEGPRREVTISKPFYMGVTEVTQAQYEAVMGTNPSSFKGPENPVETVAWIDAVEFCRKLSAKTGQKVRLPTEAQWEYACRAGTKTRFGFGDDDDDLDVYAWYTANNGSKTHPVGRKKPNAWGLYDMHGNVWEWCGDWYADSYANANNRDQAGPDSGASRVLRGGSWDYNPLHCRSAYRIRGTPDFRHYDVGFRVAVDLK